MRRQRKLDPGEYLGWLQATIHYMSLIAEAQPFKMGVITAMFGNIERPGPANLDVR
jgi:hypothetical protein